VAKWCGQIAVVFRRLPRLVGRSKEADGSSHDRIAAICFSLPGISMLPDGCRVCAWRGGMEDTICL
jgi:hypothetical protein